MKHFIISMLKGVSYSFSKIRSLFWTQYTKFKVKKCGTHLKVNYSSHFTSNTVIGNYCNFNGMNIIGGGKVVFGNHFHSGGHCMIISQNHNYEGTLIPYDNDEIFKVIEIEDNVWFGYGIVVTGNVTIGEGSIIAAGSVIVKDVPRCAIVGGNPAKVIKYRDISHYETLKQNKKFN